MKSLCPHEIMHDYGTQVSRQKETAYPVDFALSVVSGVLKKIEGMANLQPKECPKSVAILPHLHRVSHTLKGLDAGMVCPLFFQFP